MLPSPRTCIRDFSGDSEDMARFIALPNESGDDEEIGRRIIMRPRGIKDTQIDRRKKKVKSKLILYASLYFLIGLVPASPTPWTLRPVHFVHFV